MPIVTLLTDFGLEDAYAGIVKGVILKGNPDATIVDISHGVAPGDVARAAFLLETAYGYFPPGSVHVVVVDPGVGSDRRIVALEYNAHRFLAPDNGVLAGVLPEEQPGRAVSVENHRYFLSPPSRTFHGRDIFAPVAARLSSGIDLEALGPPIDCRTLVRPRKEASVTTEPHGVIGKVVAVDRFGNLITNIREADLPPTVVADGKSGLKIRIGVQTIHGLSETYTSVAPGESLAVLGSTGRLEISVNGGNAEEVFRAGPGTEVRVEVSHRNHKIN